MSTIRKTLTVFLFLLFAGQARANPALVQMWTQSQTAASVTGTFVSNVTAHDTIVFACGETSGGSTTPRIVGTSNNGNTVVTIDPFEFTGPQADYWFIIYDANAGSTSLTCTNGATLAQMCIIMLEYSGLQNTTPIDQHSSGSETFALTVTPGAITTTYEPELLITMVYDWSAINTYTVDSGFAIEAIVTGSGAEVLYVADQFVTSAVTINPTWTSSAGGLYRESMQVALRAVPPTFSGRHRLIEIKHRPKSRGRPRILLAKAE